MKRNYTMGNKYLTRKKVQKTEIDFYTNALRN